MNKADRIIKELRDMGNRGFQNFQAPGFEAHLDGTPRMAVKDMIGAAYPKKEMGSSSVLPTMGPLPSQSPTPGNVDSAAQFTIQIKRNTANIVGEILPVMVFDPIDLENGYRRALQGYIPAGVVLTSVTSGEKVSLPNTVRFTYTQGVLVDTIDITCSSAPYTSFLASLVTDKFDLNKIRFTLSDPAQVAQFANECQFYTRSMFGLGSTVPITPDNFRSPQQYQAGIVDVDVDSKFDKQSGVIVPINAVANFQVSLNCFSPRFYQQSARFW